MKTTKALSILLTTAMLIAVLPLGVIAESNTNDFAYEIIAGEVTITDYLGEGGDVVIPSEIRGYPVVQIGGDAFWYNDSIINVVISDGIKYIGDDAFAYCRYLQSVVIPDSVISIGSWAFGWCYALTEITIPATVTSMGYQAFAASSTLQNIYCEAESQPEGWYYSWLDYCTATVHWGVCMHRDTTKIEVTTNATCTQDGVRGLQCDACGRICEIYEIVEEATGHTIGEDSICVICGTDLRFEYVIENGEVTITGYLGEGGDVVIPSEIEGYPVTSIGDNAFYGCLSLISVTISKNVVSIGYSAFRDCASLMNVAISDSVKNIGSCAYYNCSSLTHIVIPDSVETMGGLVFTSGLEDIYCEAESHPEGWDYSWNEFCDADVHWGCQIEAPEFRYDIDNETVSITGYIGRNTVITIPSAIAGYPVTSIGSQTFQNCPSPEIVMIPDSVTLLGKNTFQSCDKIRDIFCQAVSQPDGWDVEWLGDCTATVHWGACMHSNAVISESVNATCTEDGYIEYTCNDCGEIYTQTIPAIGHDEGEDAPVKFEEPTCTEDGGTMTFCINCLTWFPLRVIPATGHNYVDNVCVNCGSNEPETVCGDVNGDGEINGLDATRLMQYLASMDFDTGISDVEISEGADCNGDGVVDGRDCVRLLRYLANYNPATGESEVTLGPSK